MASQHQQSPGATAVPDTVENYIGGAWTSSTNDDDQPLTRRRVRNSHRSRFRANWASTRRSELLTTHSRSRARRRRLSAVSTSSRSRPNSTSISTTSRKRAREHARRSGGERRDSSQASRTCFGREAATSKTWHATWMSSRSTSLSRVRGDYVTPPRCTPSAAARRASTATRSAWAMSAFVRRWGWCLHFGRFLPRRPARSETRTRLTSTPTKRLKLSAGPMSNQ
jgi:hypothetical protein